MRKESDRPQRRRKDWYAIGRSAALRGRDHSENPFNDYSLLDAQAEWAKHLWFCGWFDAQDLLSE
jgi:hypothetical protein